MSSPQAKEEKINPLAILFGPLKGLLADCQDTIRLQTLVAFMWVCQPFDEALVSGILEREMQQDTITAAIYQSVFASLHDRVLVSPDMAQMALRLVHVVATRRSEKAPAKPIGQLWTSIIRVTAGGKALVQKVSLFSRPVPFSQKAAHFLDPGSLPQ